VPLKHQKQRCLHPHDARLRRQPVASAGRAHQSSTTPAHEGFTGASHSIDHGITNKIKQRLQENPKLSQLLEDYQN
jgi:hypothetical protein